jgi:hypothetical protein
MPQPPSALDGYRSFIQHLATVSPPLFVMGGFAEEALLYQRITREHADLDVLALRQQLDAQLQALRGLGLAEIAPDAGESAARPLVFETGVGVLRLELWVCSPEPSGGYSFDVERQPPPGRIRIFLPEDTFQYPPPTLEGVSLQTVSPLALLHLRTISARTRGSEEKRAEDLAMAEQLRRAFPTGEDERRLLPKYGGQG